MKSRRSLNHNRSRCGDLHEQLHEQPLHRCQMIQMRLCGCFGAVNHSALANNELLGGLPAWVQVNVVTGVAKPLGHARHRVAFGVDKGGKSGKQMVPVTTNLLRGPAGKIPQRKRLPDFLCQPGNGSCVERARLSNARIPATPHPAKAPSARSPRSPSSHLPKPLKGANMNSTGSRGTSYPGNQPQKIISLPCDVLHRKGGPGRVSSPHPALPSACLW